MSALDRVVTDNSRKRDDCIDARAELTALRAKATEYDRIAVLISTVWDSPDVYAGVQRLIEEG